MDLKVAELLGARRLAATFYVALRGHHGGPTLEPTQLRSLASNGFEVGGHSLSHNSLPPLDGKEITLEVLNCKNWLDDLLGKPIRMFCYPKGRFNAKVISGVKLAGYRGARTNRMLGRMLDFSPYEMPTTLQAHPLDRYDYLRSALRAASPGRILQYLARVSRASSWVELGKELFDVVVRQGGVWHLYGHSWQIEQMGLWGDLEEILDYVAGREGVRYVTNAEVLDFLPHKIPAVSEPARLSTR